MCNKTTPKYVDKRSTGGALWIIGNKSELSAFMKRCAQDGIFFRYTPHGGKASMHSPACYTKSTAALEYILSHLGQKAKAAPCTTSSTDNPEPQESVDLHPSCETQRYRPRARYRIGVWHIELYFSSFLPDNWRESIKVCGWKWHQGRKCWYNKNTPENVEIAKQICKEMNPPPAPKRKYHVQQIVRIKSGPFAGMSGSISAIDPKRGKLKVELNMFGRFFPIDVDYSMIDDLLPVHTISMKNIVIRSNSFFCNSHHAVEDITGVIDIFDRIGTRFTRKVPMAYCKTCNLYYMLEETYLSLKRLGVVSCTLMSRKEYSRSKGNLHDPHLWRDKSPLKLLGYSTSSVDGLSKEQRLKILAGIISEELMTKDRVLSYLDFFVNLNRNNTYKDYNIACWQEDRQIVAHYGLEQLRMIYLR